MVRVMFVTSSLASGGAERQTIAIMNRLAGRGHECHAVYVKDDDPCQVDRLHLPGGTVRCLRAGRYVDWRAVYGFAAHFAAIRPDVVVAANPYALMYAILAMRGCGARAPTVFVFHSTRLVGLREQIKMLLERLFICSADRTVFVCESQRRYWSKRGLSPRHAQVIHNGVDTEQFSEVWNWEARANLRHGLGFSRNDYVVGTSAVLRAEKNHVQLVDAIAMLRDAGVQARALIIGDGPMRSAIEAHVRARGLEVGRDVIITGFQKDVRPYVAACDVVVLCSRTEAFSMAALEAMALCKPVVHSDVGGASEMIFHGRNGFLFPAGDTSAFVDKLAILANRELSKRMGNAARRAVEDLFSERSMVDRYEQLLLGVCQPASAPTLVRMRS